MKNEKPNGAQLIRDVAFFLDQRDEVLNENKSHHNLVSEYLEHTGKTPRDYDYE